LFKNCFFEKLANYANFTENPRVPSQNSFLKQPVTIKTTFRKLLRLTIYRPTVSRSCQKNEIILPLTAFCDLFLMGLAVFKYFAP
jgi:hypothetical protein